MKILIKIIEHEFIDTVISQEIIDSEVIIEEAIDTFSTARFSMPLIRIEEDNIVEIYEVNNTDTKIFRGYVYKVEPVWKQFGQINIECRSEKAIMNKRLAMQDLSNTSSDVSIVIDGLIAEYNNTYNEDWDKSLDFTEQISLEVKQGDNYFDVLDEIAEQVGALRDVKDKTIIMKKNFGKDKTSGSDYQEIIYNGLYPQSGNVSDIRVTGTATRSNIIISKDASGNKIVKQNYVDRIYGVVLQTLRNGDTSDKTDKLLENKDKKQRLYEVTVEQNSIIADIGDKIKLIIENTNSYFDINTDVIVIEKTTRYNNGSKQITYTVGDIYVETVNIQNWLYGIQKDVKLLKLG